MKEVWEFHPDYPGRYQVSSLGRVKSVTRISQGRVRAETLLSVRKDQHGYLTVQLYADRKSRIRKIHQLVLETFKTRRPFAKAVGRHLDGNRTNNVPKNLEWGTHKQNTQDAIQHGTHHSGTGSRNGNSLLTEKEVTAMWTYILGGLSVQFIADTFGVAISTVENVKFGRNWNHVTGLAVNRRKNVI